MKPLSKLSYLWRDLRYGIRNLVRWFPIIWRDRDWDDEYIFILLEFKLAQVEAIYRSKPVFVGQEREARNIHIARLLIKRILTSPYHDMAFRAHKRRWGEAVMIETPTRGWVRRDFVYPRAKNQKEQERAKREASRCVKHAQYLEKQDVEYLFHHLKRHIRKWWD